MNLRSWAIRRRWQPILFASFGWVSTLAGCAPPDESAAHLRIDSTAGAVVVTNGGPGSWKPAERWRIREEYRLAGDEGLLLTNGLSGATLGPSGRIFVLDFVASELVSVSGGGSDLRRVAASGPGPRELGFAGGMGWDRGGRLWVADGRGSYSVWDSAGRFIRSVPRPIRGLLRRQFPLVFVDDQTLIDEAIGARGVVFVAVNVATGTADTLVSLVLRPSVELPRIILRPGHDRIQFVLNHYRPENLWAVGKDGTAWIARSDSLRLFRIDLSSGDTLRVVNTDHRSAELSGEDIAIIRDGLAEVGLDPEIGGFGRPLIQSIHLTGDGYVLVQIIEDIGEEAKVMDVFDPRGVFLGSVEMPFGIAWQSRASIVGDTLVAITLGPNDEPYLVRSTIIRPQGPRPEAH